ncbi:hypothetical protein WJX73_001233 [Symbiochloris irregularis]|uniref:Uncharacterized protein n=1 Tax=Symbiochloris irregularis TaxID=706552 RepID=A0AAW1PBJ3_9CHLO
MVEARLESSLLARPAVGIPVKPKEERQEPRQFYSHGGMFFPMDFSKTKKARCLAGLENTLPAQRLHMLKSAPFVRGADREFDPFKGVVRLMNHNGITAKQLAKHCQFTGAVAKILVYHVSTAPAVWPYSKYMRSRLGATHWGELTWTSRLWAKLTGRPLPNVPEHWL